MTKRIIAIDLDGTLAEYHGWKGVTHIGKPVPAIVNAAKKAKEEGADIWIFTARVSSEEDGAQASHYIVDWLENVDLQVDGITAIKHKFFTEIWDDRAIQVVRNTGEMVMHPDYHHTADKHGEEYESNEDQNVIKDIGNLIGEMVMRGDANNHAYGHPPEQGQLFTPAEDSNNPLDVQEGGNHYKKYPIQPIEFCHVNKIPSLESSIIKYVVRHKDKNGIEDLKKAKHILDILIKLEYNK